VCDGKGKVKDLNIIKMKEDMNYGMLVLGRVIVKRKKNYMVSLIVRKLKKLFGEMKRKMNKLCLMVV
jgi:hypothetical protein